MTSDGGVIVATVWGSGSHEVLLQLSGDTFFGSCTSPFFVDHVQICKHIWATILQIEGGLITDVIPSICATGRCVLRTAAVDAPVTRTTLSSPVEWYAGPPWAFTLAKRATTM